DNSEERRIKTGSLDVWINLNLDLLLQSNAGRKNVDRENFRGNVARQVCKTHIFKFRFIATCATGSAQRRAPLNEARFRTGDLRSSRVVIGTAPIAPRDVGPLAIAAPRLQFDWAGTAPPDSSPTRN